MLTASFICFASFDALIYLASSDAFWLVPGAAGVVAGTMMFFRGLKMLQYKRLILNTPFSKIHSASIGLVEVTGMPVGPKTLAAPATGDDCFYYHVRAWQWELSGNENGQWKLKLDESSYVPFFLEDSTGRVLVNAQDARMDVHTNFSDEIYVMTFAQKDLIPGNIRNFVVMRGLIPHDKIKIEERVIKRGYPLFVFGTLGENSAPESWNPTPHLGDVSAGGRSINFNFNGLPGLGITFRSTITTQITTTPQSMTRGTAARPSDGGQARQGGQVATAVLDAPSQQRLASQPSEAFDLHASAAIGKGTRGEPFTISSESQREVVEALAWKSTALIWGGPIIAASCLYFLIVYLR
jgi:hypothetical protein